MCEFIMKPLICFSDCNSLVYLPHSFNSTQKEALAQEIFHRVVLEYLTCVYKFLSPEEADKKMHDLLES